MKKKIGVYLVLILVVGYGIYYLNREKPLPTGMATGKYYDFNKESFQGVQSGLLGNEKGFALATQEKYKIRIYQRDADGKELYQYEQGLVNKEAKLNEVSFAVDGAGSKYCAAWVEVVFSVFHEWGVYLKTPTDIKLYYRVFSADGGAMDKTVELASYQLNLSQAKVTEFQDLAYSLEKFNVNDLLNVKVFYNEMYDEFYVFHLNKFKPKMTVIDGAGFDGPEKTLGFYLYPMKEKAIAWLEEKQELVILMHWYADKYRLYICNGSGDTILKKVIKLKYLTQPKKMVISYEETENSYLAFVSQADDLNLCLLDVKGNVMNMQDISVPAGFGGEFAAADYGDSSYDLFCAEKIGKTEKTIYRKVIAGNESLMAYVKTAEIDTKISSHYLSAASAEENIAFLATSGIGSELTSELFVGVPPKLTGKDFRGYQQGLSKRFAKVRYDRKRDRQKKRIIKRTPPTGSESLRVKEKGYAVTLKGPDYYGAGLAYKYYGEKKVLIERYNKDDLVIEAGFIKVLSGPLRAEFTLKLAGTDSKVNCTLKPGEKITKDLGADLLLQLYTENVAANVWTLYIHPLVIKDGSSIWANKLTPLTEEQLLIVYPYDPATVQIKMDINYRLHAMGPSLDPGDYGKQNLKLNLAEDEDEKFVKMISLAEGEEQVIDPFYKYSKYGLKIKILEFGGSGEAATLALIPLEKELECFTIKDGNYVDTKAEIILGTGKPFGYQEEYRFKVGEEEHFLNIVKIKKITEKGPPYTNEDGAPVVPIIPYELVTLNVDNKIIFDLKFPTTAQGATKIPAKDLAEHGIPVTITGLQWYSSHPQLNDQEGVLLEISSQ